MLRTQYRMHEHIMEFSNGQFYGGELEAADSVAQWKLKESTETGMVTDTAVHFIDTAGASYEEIYNPESMSLRNPEEAGLVFRHLIQTLLELPKPDKDDPGAVPTIGIIAPYKDQVRLLRKEIHDYKALWPWTKYISIDTVDGFQGQERDIIYISLVRSNAEGTIGFLGNTRRMNVAMTRARKLLVMIGDSSSLGNHRFYSAFLDFVDQRQAYRSVWEFMT